MNSSPAESRPLDELRMSGSEFDKLMRKALQVGPGEAPKPKKAGQVKAKAAPAKKRATKK